MYKTPSQRLCLYNKVSDGYLKNMLEKKAITLSVATAGDPILKTGIWYDVVTQSVSFHNLFAETGESVNTIHVIHDTINLLN